VGRARGNDASGLGNLVLALHGAPLPGECLKGERLLG
jgi:hypothetical protein